MINHAQPARDCWRWSPSLGLTSCCRRVRHLLKIQEGLDNIPKYRLNDHWQFGLGDNLTVTELWEILNRLAMSLFAQRDAYSVLIRKSVMFCAVAGNRLTCQG